jgi:hypothetical protein
VPPGLRLDQHEADHDDGEDCAHILAVGRRCEPQAEQRPVGEPAHPQGTVEGQSGQRPEGQLDQVGIEVARIEVEEDDAVQQQDRDERAERADDQSGQPPHRPEGDRRQQLAGKEDGPALISGEPVHGA